MLSIQRHSQAFVIASPSLSRLRRLGRRRHIVPRLDSISRIPCVLRTRTHVAHYGIV
jgi:hypothetical protein